MHGLSGADEISSFLDDYSFSAVMKQNDPKSAQGSESLVAKLRKFGPTPKRSNRLVYCKWNQWKYGNRWCMLETTGLKSGHTKSAHPLTRRSKIPTSSRHLTNLTMRFMAFLLKYYLGFSPRVDFTSYAHQEFPTQPKGPIHTGCHAVLTCALQLGYPFRHYWILT